MEQLIKELQECINRMPNDPTDVEKGYTIALQHTIILIKEKYLNNDKRTN